MLLQQCQESIEAFTFLWQDAIVEVGAIETGDVLLRLAQMQLVDDVASHPFSGRGRQRQKWHPGQAATQFAQPAVIGAEVVPPHGDAVRFVDSHKADLEAGKKTLESLL